MSDKAALIKATILALLPDGVIWTPEINEDMDKLLDAMSENWLDAYNAALTLGDIRDPSKTQLLRELELEFGFLENNSLSEELRRQQIAAVKFENTDQRNSADDVQAFLNAAGFDVQVHHNDPAADPALFPGDIFLSDGKYVKDPNFLAQCGGAYSYCGHQNATCGYFETFEYLDFEYVLPTDPALWPFIYFIGGDAVRDGSGYLTSIAPAEIPVYRQDKFIELALSSKPWFDWVVLIVDYIWRPQDIPGLKLDLNAANYLESVTMDELNRISQFRDDSGRDNHASQPLPDSRATLILEAINGQPGVRFDGVDDFFDLADVLPNAGDFTFYVVLKLPDPILSSPESPSQIICGVQEMVEPRGAILLGASSSGIAGETFTVVGVKTETPFSVSLGYLNTDIAAGTWVIEVKLQGSTLTTTFNGVSQTLLFQHYLGNFGTDRSLKNVNRIGANATGLAGFLDADMGRILYYDRATKNEESDLLTDLLLNFWT